MELKAPAGSETFANGVSSKLERVTLKEKYDPVAS
jgi:hypothetical protein